MFSLCSSILLPSFISILMTSTLNSYQINYLSFISFFPEILSYSYLGHIPLFLHFACLYVAFLYPIYETTTSSSLKGVALCRR